MRKHDCVLIDNNELLRRPDEVTVSGRSSCPSTRRGRAVCCSLSINCKLKSECACTSLQERESPPRNGAAALKMRGRHERIFCKEPTGGNVAGGNSIPFIIVTSLLCALHYSQLYSTDRESHSDAERGVFTSPRRRRIAGDSSPNFYPTFYPTQCPTSRLFSRSATYINVHSI